MTRAVDPASNGAHGTIDGAVTAVATSCTLLGGFADLPTIASGDGHQLVVWDNTNYETIEDAKAGTDAYDIARITTRSSGTVSVMVRGQEGVTAIAWSDTWRWDFNPTAKTQDDISAGIEDGDGHWENPIRPPHNGLWDGSNDSTPLGSAISTAHSSNRKVHLPGGTGSVDTISLSAADQIEIVGLGMTKSIIQHRASASDSMFEHDAGANLSLFVMRDLTIDGNKDNLGSRVHRAIEIRADIAIFERVEFKNTIKAAVSLLQVSKYAIFKDCYFHDCALHGGSADQDSGFILIGKTVADSATEQSTVYVENCYFEQPALLAEGDGAYGIVSNPDETLNQRIVVKNCDFLNIGQYNAANSNFSAAVHIYEDGDGSIIEGNNFTNCPYTAIRAQMSSNLRIQGNTIGATSQYTTVATGAISIEDRVQSVAATNKNVKILDNTVTGTDFDFGLVVDFAASYELTGLTVRGNEFDGQVGGALINHVVGDIKFVENTWRGLTGNVNNRHPIEADNFTSQTDVLITGNHFNNLQRGAVDITPSSGQNVRVTSYGNSIENIGQGTAEHAFDVRNVDSFHAWGNVFDALPGSKENYHYVAVTDVQVDVLGQLFFTDTGDVGLDVGLYRSALNVLKTDDEIDVSKKATLYRIHSGGAALVAGNIIPNANWGGAATITSVAGTDTAGTFIVTASTTPGANPTLTITFTDGTFDDAPIVVVTRVAGAQLTVADSWVTTAATLVITFNGTPLDAETFTYAFHTIGQ